jgi:rare lipoprotein A
MGFRLGYAIALWPAALAGMGVASTGDAAEPALAAVRPAGWRTVVVPDAPITASIEKWDTSVRELQAQHARSEGSPKITTGALGRPMPQSSAPSLVGPGHALDGVASFYWQGQSTASGEPFDRGAMTAAHPTLPFNTRVRVTHLQTGRSVEVRINDRGPFKPGRVIDLSHRAAEELGIVTRGLARVRLEVVSN